MTTSAIPTLIDTHCHLDMPDYSNDFEAVLERAARNGISRIMTIGIDLLSTQKAIELARNYRRIRASIGVHPHNVDSLTDNVYASLESLYRKNNKYVSGYGEIGLDYVKKHAQPEQQRYHFAKQLELAASLQLPVIIHDREAHTDTLQALEQPGCVRYGGVIHCFSGDYQYAKRVLNLGMMISIPGIITFNNTEILADVVRRIPLTSIILETDGPFLAPHPHRGKRNEPSFIVHTARRTAEIKKNWC